MNAQDKVEAAEAAVDALYEAKEAHEASRVATKEARAVFKAKKDEFRQARKDGQDDDVLDQLREEMGWIFVEIFYYPGINLIDWNKSRDLKDDFNEAKSEQKGTKKTLLKARNEAEKTKEKSIDNCV